MNKKLVFHVIGKLLCAVSLMLIAPMIVSIIYTEQSWWSFGVTAVISLALGILLLKITKGFSRVIYAKEGFAIVSLSWITVSLIGSLPFIIARKYLLLQMLFLNRSADIQQQVHQFSIMSRN